MNIIVYFFSSRHVELKQIKPTYVIKIFFLSAFLFWLLYNILKCLLKSYTRNGIMYSMEFVIT